MHARVDRSTESGNSQLLGCPSLALTDDVKARLGYVSQSPELFEWLRVGEQIADRRALRPSGRRSARASVMRFSIAEDMSTYAVARRETAAGYRSRLRINPICWFLTSRLRAWIQWVEILVYTVRANIPRR